MRYRGTAIDEFWRALKMKALQAEQAAETGLTVQAHGKRPATLPPLAHRPQPSEPERRSAHVVPEPGAPGRALHEPVVAWLPDEAEAGVAPGISAPVGRMNLGPLFGQTTASAVA